jgi:hypothetical protein
MFYGVLGKTLKWGFLKKKKKKKKSKPIQNPQEKLSTKINITKKKKKKSFYESLPN